MSTSFTGKVAARHVAVPNPVELLHQIAAHLIQDRLEVSLLPMPLTGR